MLVSGVGFISFYTLEWPQRAFSYSQFFNRDIAPRSSSLCSPLSLSYPFLPPSITFTSEYPDRPG